MPKGTVAHGAIHARAEEMSKKEGDIKEKSKKQSGKTLSALTDLFIAFCSAHHITERTEHNMQQNKGRKD